MGVGGGGTRGVGDVRDVVEGGGVACGGGGRVVMGCAGRAGCGAVGNTTPACETTGTRPGPSASICVALSSTNGYKS